MKANPTTFYEPQNRDLFDETTAEILTGVTTYHALPKEKKEQLKKHFSERVLDYFDELNLAPTLDNLLLHQTELRKEISFQLATQEAQIQHEEFLGLGKKAKARRQARKAAKATSTTTKDTSNWRNAWDQNGNWLGESVPMDTNLENQLAQVEGKKERSNWQDTLNTILGTTTTVVGAIQQNKQQNAIPTTQANFFPTPEPKKPKVLGMEPVVGIAAIILILAVFGFLLWQLSQKQ